MISAWRRRKAARRAEKIRQDGQDGEMELVIPNNFRCPISLDLMKDPVTLSTGITYDRESIEKWIEAGHVTCPITNQVLRNFEPIPNHAIRKMIQDWCVDNKAFGVERIPTPRVPVSSTEVSEINSKITLACEKRDRVVLENLVGKIRTLMKESERNKRCIVSNGTASVLSSAFERFTMAGIFQENVSVLDEILSCLTLMLPLEGEAKSHLGSQASMDCIVKFLQGGDLATRRNAVLVLKEIVTSDPGKAEVLSGISGAMEALFMLIKEPICPATTKASLMVIYRMVTSNQKIIISRSVDMGMVLTLLEMLVDAEKSICEKVLGVLDGILTIDEGRDEAYNNHALAIPILVKKLHRVSDLATEFSVSILWRMLKTNERTPKEDVLIVEALQVGAFQKLLLLLQVGCSERTKEKATELLKMLNGQRARLECIDSMDFKDLKRAF